MPHTESWLPVVHDPAHEVSDRGRIRRVEDGRIVPQYIQAGYHGAYFGGRHQLTHRVVYEVFILGAPVPRSQEVAHRDGNRSNNHLTNLVLSDRAGTIRRAC